MSDRHFQDSAGTVNGKIDRARVVTRCTDCSSGETIYCGRYGRKIQYPISGPIPSWCRLRNAPNPLDEE
jgi:hypothetical protein